MNEIKVQLRATRAEPMKLKVKFHNSVEWHIAVNTAPKTQLLVCPNHNANARKNQMLCATKN